jgi:hypothetical protein
VLSTLRSKLSYANVMATVAVFIALGGTSVAAISLTRNSVRSKHIAKGQVKRSDVGRNAVNSAKVANRSLRLIDFRAGQLPTGPPGAPGTPGAPGSPAASMLMGTVPSAVTSESTNGTFGFPPLGVADQPGGSMLSPNQTVVLRDLSVRVVPAPGGAATRTAYVGILGGSLPPDAAISCAVGGGETTCDSGNATLTVPAGSPLTFALQNGAVAPANSTVQFGYRATTP